MKVHKAGLIPIQKFWAGFEDSDWLEKLEQPTRESSLSKHSVNLRAKFSL